MVLNLQKKKEYWNNEVNQIGYNYRLTDFQASLGISQLKKINFFIREKQNIAKRVKFSTLMKDDIKNAFVNIQDSINVNIAYAGLTRHTIDFLYGMNISRALSRAFMTSSKKYRTLSIGRVQGPTIAYIVENELAKDSHVPLPFWSINTYIDSEKNHNGKWIKIQYIEQKILQT